MPESNYFPLESFNDSHSEVLLSITPHLTFVDILNLAKCSTALKSMFYSDEIWHRKIYHDFGITVDVVTSYLQRVNSQNNMKLNSGSEALSVRVTPLHLYKLLKEKIGFDYSNCPYNAHVLNENDQAVFLSCCFDDYQYFSEHVPYQTIDWWFDWSLVLGCRKIPENLFKAKRIIVKDANLLLAAHSNLELAKLFVHGKEISTNINNELVTLASEEFIDHLQAVNLIVLTEKHFLLALNHRNSPVKMIGKKLYQVGELDKQVSAFIESKGVSDVSYEEQEGKIWDLLYSLVHYHDIELFKNTIEILKNKIKNFTQVFLTHRILREARSYSVCQYLVEDCKIIPDDYDIRLAISRDCVESFRLFTKYASYSLPINPHNDQFFLDCKLSEDLWNEVLVHCRYQPDIIVINSLLSKNQVELAKKYMSQHDIIPNAESVIAITQSGSIDSVLWLLEMEINGKKVIELTDENKKSVLKSAIYSRNQKLVGMLISRFSFDVTNDLVVVAAFSSNLSLSLFLRELLQGLANTPLRIYEFISYSSFGIYYHIWLDNWINGWPCVRYLFNPFNNIEWDESLTFFVDSPAYRLISQFALLIKQNANNSNKIGFNSIDFSKEFPYSFDCPMVCYDWVDFLFVHHDRLETKDLIILLTKDWIKETPSPIGRHYLAQFAEQGLVELPKETIESLKKSSAEMLNQNQVLKEIVYPDNKDINHSSLRLKM